MTDIVTFLTARLDEDEALARKTQRQVSDLLNGSDPAVVGHWFVTQRPSSAIFVAAKDQWDRETEIVPTYGGGYADHIARHDPARVLREVAAKRAIVALHEAEHDLIVRDGRYVDLPFKCAACFKPYPQRGQAEEWPCSTVRQLAAVYADHPDFNESWRP